MPPQISHAPHPYSQVRATTIGMILATDLSQNFPTINAFKAMLTDYKTEAADSGSPGRRRRRRRHGRHAETVDGEEGVEDRPY